MPNVTVSGPSGSVVQIPINSGAAAALARSELNAVSAAVAANPGAAAFVGAAPALGTELVFEGAANAATVAGTFGAMVSNATGITSIVSAQTAAATWWLARAA